MPITAIGIEEAGVIRDLGIGNQEYPAESTSEGGAGCRSYRGGAFDRE